jgi:hypothetical protein
MKTARCVFGAVLGLFFFGRRFRLFAGQFLRRQNHHFDSVERSRRHGGYAYKIDDGFSSEVHSRESDDCHRVYAGSGRPESSQPHLPARPDGLVILSGTSGLIPSAIMGETGVLYDIDKLIYLGTPYSEFHAVFFTRKEVGLNTIDKLRAASGLRIGAQSIGHATYREGRVFSYLLGLTRPSFVVGFSGPEIDLALERGELDARSSATESVLQRNPDRLEKGSVHFHSMFETPRGHKHPRFGYLPEIETFAKFDKERKLMALVRNLKSTGAPLVLPPGTPDDRVQILRQAFRRMFRDPAFHEEFKSEFLKNRRLLHRKPWRA